MAKAAQFGRVRHKTDGLIPLFVMPDEYRTVFMQKKQLLLNRIFEKLQEVQE